MPNKYSVILVGGGTGGHIMPLVAVGEELKNQKITFLYVGGANSREQEIVNDLKWPFQPISAGKWRRYSNVNSIFLNIVDLFKILAGIVQSIYILQSTKAKVVFSKGGFIALSMVFACRVTGTPLIIHESDAVMGTTNRVSSKWAKKVLTAFAPNVYANFNDKYVQTGIPIRSFLRKAAGLKAPNKVMPLVMVLGGIQGAMAVNNLIENSLSQLLQICDVVHSTGEHEIAKFTEVKNNLDKKISEHYKPFSFIDRELPYYFQTADIIVSRSSATTMAEAALFGKALYLIPLPNAAGNHQVVNAEKLVEKEAAIMRIQSELTAGEFMKDIELLLGKKEKLSAFGQNLKKYFNEEKSVHEIVDIITAQIEDNGKN